jgi:Coenzyme PQQ synthesis protein D (PqqD)
VYRRNPKVEEAPLQGELMLFDPDRSKFFVLNPTMAVVWRGCDGQTTFEGMLDAIRASFSEADTAPVETEVRNALGQLIELGLATTVEGP